MSVSLSLPIDGNGNVIGPGNPLAVQAAPSAVGGMTSVSVGTTSAQVLAARSGRRRLSFQNTGVGRITLRFSGSAATLGAGIVLDPAAVAGGQGGAWEEPGHDCWAGAVQAIASAATTLTIIEG